MTDLVKLYRDDGPLARALGATLGRAVPVAPELLILAGLVPLLAVAAIGGGDVSHPAAAAVLAWTVLTVGASSGRRGADKSRWAQPPLVLATEYTALIWIAALEGADAYPAAFALLAALTFRHYDLAYRPRHLGTTPAPWVNALAGGWDGRVVAGFVLLAAGALPAGFFVAAAVLGVAFVGEAAAAWLIHGRDPVPLGPGDEDEEDEA
jgi:Family of unknown function (DUF5941)